MDWAVIVVILILIVSALLLYYSQVRGAGITGHALDNNPYLYHYTTLEGAIGIRKARRIQMSRTAMQDAAFGDGVYLTSMQPGHGRSRIVANNYDGGNPSFARTYPQLMDKVNFYFRFRMGDLPGVHSTSSTRDVWLYRGDILLDKVDHVVGETEATVRLHYDKNTGAMVRVTFH